PTLADTSEFSAGSRTELIPFYVGHPNPAYGKVDLLTVVAHELGHVLGYEDAGSEGLMAEYLGTGVRRVPALGKGDDKAFDPRLDLATDLKRSVSSPPDGYAAPTGNLDHFFALASVPRETSTMDALGGEGLLPIG